MTLFSPIAYLRDVGSAEDPCYVPCAQGDPGSFGVYPMEQFSHVIRAAPDMYEALKWMVENDDTNEGDEAMAEHDGKSWDEINGYWIAGLNRARAALAKARGDPS